MYLELSGILILKCWCMRSNHCNNKEWMSILVTYLDMYIVYYDVGW